MDPAPSPTESVDLDPLKAVRILQAAGGAMFVQALLHSQLAAIEWQEEKHRLLRMLAITLVGFACLVCALLFAGGLALTATWETGYRMHALAALVLMFGLGAAAAWRRFEVCSAAGRLFAASREELAADAAMLKASP